MMFFGDRKKLEAEFRKWAEENNAACSMFNAITWLVEVKGYQQPEPPKKELICQITIDGEEILRKAVEKVELDGKTLAEWLELVKGYKKLETELEAVKRERDAAVRDISSYKLCKTCAHRSDSAPLYQCPHYDGGYLYTCWQWRGVCPENTEVQEDDR